MIRAVYRNGTIEPVDEVPADWQEGAELEVRPLPKRDAVSDTDDWISERGAYANYTGEMPQHVRDELERRIAAFHALGPMELEPGEEEEMQRLWREMDELGRREMQRLFEEGL
jgi:hypothetical protein